MKRTILSLISLSCFAPVAFAAPGTLTINGNLTVQTGATVNIEVASTTPGTGHDEVIISGSLNLIGAGPTLNVTAISGYVGAAPDVIDIFDSTSATGTFNTLNLPAGNWSTTNLYTLGQIQFQVVGGFAAFLAANSLASATSDEDGDGLNSLAEYGLGGIPVAGAGSSSTLLLPQPKLVSNFLNLNFSLPGSPPSDVIYTIQAIDKVDGFGGEMWVDIATKTGAGAWSGAATVISGAPSGGRTPYTLSDVQALTGEPNRSMRLKMTLTP